jgi:hypothetical protein
MNATITPTPTTSNVEQQDSCLSYLRGFGFALLFGAVGFAAPIIVLVSLTLLNWTFTGASDFDRKYDVDRLPEKLTYPAFVVSWVFAATGWATFAPRRHYRFTKTLFMITVISVPLWYVLGSMGMSPPRYKGIDHPLFYPSEILLFVIPPPLIAAILSIIRCKKQSATTST